ncbi:unnamed protein product, partial [marine sediment metagenome]
KQNIPALCNLSHAFQYDGRALETGNLGCAESGDVLFPTEMISVVA